MSDNKTVPTNTPVMEFLETITNNTRREDSLVLMQIMKEITGHSPVLWGTSLIDFDSYHYKYDTGTEGDMLVSGFSPRKQNLALYNTGFVRYPELLQKLGKHKTGKSCLYINKLSDVNIDILKTLIETSYNHMKMKYNN